MPEGMATQRRFGIGIEGFSHLGSTRDLSPSLPVGPRSSKQRLEREALHMQQCRLLRKLCRPDQRPDLARKNRGLFFLAVFGS